MAVGSEPKRIRRLLRECVSPLSLGACLCGAGGGGFALVVLRRGVSIADLRAAVSAFQSAEKRESHGSNGGDEGDEDEGEEGGDCMSVHAVRVDGRGLSCSLLDGSRGGPLSDYFTLTHA
jgi:hypothetical protein